MLIGFLGAPISGKTTTAARLFAGLKDDGEVAEFLPEQARAFIARKRYEALKRGVEVEPLTDSDQRDILYRQYMMEKIFTTSSPTSTIITDCAAFLALLYMTPKMRTDADVLAKAKASAASFDLLFRCHPVKPGELYDPNRAHSFEQSQAIDAQLDDIIKLVEVPPDNIFGLFGPSHVRATWARNEMTERMLCRR